MTDRAHLSLTLVAHLERREAAPVPAPRHLREDDRPRLARASWRRIAADSTIRATMTDVKGHLWKFFDSGLATPLPECSFVARDAGRIVAATLVCMDDGRPLLARAYTVPSWQNRGLARALIQLGQKALLERGEDELTLIVKVGNLSARHLYESMGFVVERGPDGARVRC